MLVLKQQTLLAILKRVTGHLRYNFLIIIFTYNARSSKLTSRGNAANIVYFEVIYWN